MLAVQRLRPVAGAISRAPALLPLSAKLRRRTASSRDGKSREPNLTPFSLVAQLNVLHNFQSPKRARLDQRNNNPLDLGSTIKLLTTLRTGRWQLQHRQRLRRRQSSGRRRMSELLDHAQRRLELLPQRLVLCEALRECRLHLPQPIRSPLLRPRCASAISQQPARRSGVDALRVVGELAARNSRHRRCRRCRATANAVMACDGGRSVPMVGVETKLACVCWAIRVVVQGGAETKSWGVAAEAGRSCGWS